LWRMVISGLSAISAPLCPTPMSVPMCGVVRDYVRNFVRRLCRTRCDPCAYTLNPTVRQVCNIAK
jgi:hypothetical protein